MSTTKWTIDPSHSEISFRVKHLMITNVKGTFGSFNAEITSDGDDLTTSNVTFTADVASISTGHEHRDGHMLSSDFFDAEKYPTITFNGKGLTAASEKGHYTMTGDLTLKGVTKAIVLNVELAGVMTDPYSNVKAGFIVNGKINRLDFGLEWNTPLEAGGVLLADDVFIACEVQFAKVAETASSVA
jgi:polyisoprenoid-binding protein YceI